MGLTQASTSMEAVMAEPSAVAPTAPVDDHVYMNIGRLWARLLALEFENRELKRRLIEAGVSAPTEVPTNATR